MSTPDPQSPARARAADAWGVMTRLRRIRSDERGLGLVEVLVASTVLLVGMLGTVSMLDMASTVTTTTKAREQAVSLQREIIEEVRSVPYDALIPTSVVSEVQAASATLADAHPSQPGWTIRRRGYTYTVAVGVCDVDDPNDGTGDHDGTLFCATGPGSTTPTTCRQLLGVDGSIQGTSAAATAGVSVGDCGIDLDLDGAVDNLTQASVGICLLVCPTGGTDTVPSDYKRLIVLVRWDRGGGTRYALQSSAVANPGVARAPAVTAVTPGTSSPVTSGTSVSFTATTNLPAATVGWYVDGTSKGGASGSGTSWAFDWPLGAVSTGSTPNSNEVLDGSYLLGAKAFDANGQFGSVRQVTVTVNRRAPYPVKELDAGRNGSVVDVEWRANPERDIAGYRVYRRPLVGSPVQVCALTQQTSCQDTSPPAGSLTYFAVAVDRTTAGALREGTPSGDVSVAATNTPPTAPTNLQVSTSSGVPVLTWNAASDPDLFDSIEYYRIYRDGTTVAARFDRTGTGSELTWTDAKAGGVSRTYRVKAVDTNMAESTFAGPVSTP